MPEQAFPRNEATSLDVPDDLARTPRTGRFRFALLAGALTLAYAPTLARLFAHAVQSDLHSYIPLIPVVAGYLFYLRRDEALSARRGSVVVAALVAMVGTATLLIAARMSSSLSVNDRLGLLVVSYLTFLLALGFLFMGTAWIRANLFATAFLFFMVPLPDAVVYWLETWSVLASADVSAVFLQWTGTPMLREGTVFRLPGLVIRVAQECSGIRSSWILFITSVVAAHLFLRSPARRLFLVAFVLPLAIVRNAFRIVVISLLSVHIGRHMMDSFIHRRGGPIFFALSLVPFLGLLVWLRRRERRKRFD